MASTAGRPPIGSALTPLSIATFCRIGIVVGFEGTYIVPAGYDLLFAFKGVLIQYTSSFALSSRLTATNASFTSWLMRYPPPLGAWVTEPGLTGTGALSFSNGPSKPSSMRSNRIPIEYDRLYPVTSYGGRGGPPGYGMSFG